VVGAAVVVVGAAVVAVVVVGTAVVVVVGASVVDVLVVDVDVVVGALVVVVEVAAKVVVVDVDVEVVEVDVREVVLVSSASEELQPATSSTSAARISAAGDGRRSEGRCGGSGNSVIAESGGSLPGRRAMDDQPTTRRYCRTVNGKNTSRIAAIQSSARHP